MRAAGAGTLVIEVSDTGVGIEPEVLPRIFDPFQQGETTIIRRFGGLGLGLAICKGIVEAHGGMLEAESPGKGRGTTFRVELEALPEPEAGADGPAAGCGDSAPRGAGPLRILVVEDEPATLRLMARLLRGSGMKSWTAGTLASALEVARTRAVRPDRQRHRPAGRQRAGPDASGHGRAGGLPGDRPDGLRDGGRHPPQPGGGILGPHDQADRLLPS